MATQSGDAAGQPEEGEQSLSDIGNLFGEKDDPQEELDEEESDESEVEEPDEASAVKEPKEEETFTIKHDGKEVVLKKSEYDEMAQKGFDYTSKTMAVAEERKQAETARTQGEQFRQENERALQHSVSQLQAYETFIQSQIGQPPPIAWAQQDAAYYLAQKELYESRRGQLQEAQQRIQQLQGEEHRQRQARLNQTANETERALRDTIPGFGDETIDDLAKYIGKLGLNANTTADAFVQKGIWELAVKAKAYDALQAQKAQIKPTKDMPKVHKPSASNPPAKSASEQSRRVEAFSKNPSLTSLGALI